MRRGMPSSPSMCCGKNVRLKPMKTSQKCSFPRRSSRMPAEHLRPPVVEAAEDPEDRAAEQHVVEVRDDEVGVGHLPVDRERREEDPREAADREDADEAERPQHRRVERDVPAPDRREPVEDLHARRDRDDHRADHEEDVEPDRHARPRTCGAPRRAARRTRCRPSRSRPPCSRRSACARRRGGPPR